MTALSSQRLPPTPTGDRRTGSFSQSSWLAPSGLLPDPPPTRGGLFLFSREIASAARHFPCEGSTANPSLTPQLTAGVSHVQLAHALVRRFFRDHRRLACQVRQAA